ncbi:hypothetical protein D3C77_655190 [compost metagenome]
MQLSGFVYNDPDSDNKGDFILGRFLVQCCTADAYPFGVVITSAQSLPHLEQDTWVEVRGTLQTMFRDGREIIAISAEKIREIPRPDTPYVYPNDDAVKVWDLSIK